MKKFATLIMACLFFSFTATAADSPTADQKWSAAVKKMVEKGSVTLSTTAESRVKIAQEIASQKGRTCKVTRVGNAWRIEVSAPKGSETSAEE